MKVYRIANWEQTYETSETRKMMYLRWVPTPNKHDGLGFRRMATQRNRCELFSAWNLILQIASKGRKGVERGKLIRDGKALTAVDLAIMTGFPTQNFITALEFFSSAPVGWLVIDNEPITESPEISAEPPEASGNHPAEGRKEGIEGKRPNASAHQQTDEELLAELRSSSAYHGIDIEREFQKMIIWCNLNRKEPTHRRFVNWLNRADKPMQSKPPRKGPNI